MPDRIDAHGELNLPDELSQLELQLLQLAPAGSELNRDTLMYQAGWEAAEAQASHKTPWFWPASTTGMAALLLVSLVLRPASVPVEKEVQIVKTVVVGEPVASLIVESTTPQPALIQVETTPQRRYSPKASLLVMRERALRQDFEEPTYEAFVDDEPVQATTSRELLEELMPELKKEKPSNRGPWWTRFRFGESV